jgi:hypothetical protein
VPSRGCGRPAPTRRNARLSSSAGRPLSGFAHDRLERAGVLEPAGHDRYYLNEARYKVYRGRRRTRATVVLALLVIGIFILYLLRDLL